jgi:hypothetical protein
MDHEEYLKRVKSYIKTPTKDLEQQLEEFCGFCSYISGQYDQDESFINLNKHLEELEKGRSETHRIFYMALPPSVFIPVSQHLKRNCYPTKGISRVIVSIHYHLFLRESDLTDGFCRSRSRSAKILPAPESFSARLRLTGSKTRSSELTTTWARKWSRISSFFDSETSSLAPRGTGTTLTTFRYADRKFSLVNL